MTQKEFRQLAMETLAKYMRGDISDVTIRDAAIAALNAPCIAGE